MSVGQLGATGLYLSGLATMGALFLASTFGSGDDPDAGFWDFAKSKVDASEMYCEVDGELGPVIRDAENGEVVYAAMPESRTHARVQTGYNMDIGESGQRCDVDMLHGGGRIFEMKS